jgi:uncharacterized protein YndB with AHSA1/START domain
MEQANKELTITRIINAPRELVFKVWTDPNHLAQWWGPHGFTNPLCEVDAKAGGKILIHMKGPDGVVYPMSGMYKEVVVPEKLVFVSWQVDANNKALFEVQNTITFAEENGKTKLTMHASVSKITADAAPYLAGMEIGWNQTLERLDNYMAIAKI